MKKTDFLKQVEKDNLRYELVKYKYYLQKKLLFGEKRKKAENLYKFFAEDHFLARKDNSLPEGKYFKPTDIIIYDLIQKEDLPKVKKGLIKLFRDCYSHKFFWGSSSNDDIDKLISQLDKTIHSGNSWFRIGLFDFAKNEDLDSYINYFETRFHNFSSSFAAIEMRIVLTTEFSEEISDFIKSSFNKTQRCIHRFWSKNRKKSGATISFGVSEGMPDEYAKSQIVYEQLQYVKTRFIHILKRYFPLMLCSKCENICGINAFETNITLTDNLEYQVYAGLGLFEMYGFNISNSERLYVSTKIGTNENDNDTDMMLIFNPDYVNDYKMFSTKHNKVMTCFMHHMEEIYRIVIIKNFGVKYYDLISKYRNIVNKSKTGKRQNKALLELKYQLNKSFYNFNKIGEELPVNKEFEKIEAIIESNEYAKASIYRNLHPYKLLTSTPEWIWQQVRNNYCEVENDLDRKLEISDSLTKYKNEQTNRKLAFIQVILAVLTFYLLIFPDRAKEISDYILEIKKFFVLIL